MRKVYWDENANPIGTHLANIIYELRSEDDGDDLILDAVCLADFEETSESVMYDALVTEYRLLERKMNVMRRVMNRVSDDLKVREDNGPDDMGVIISKPFKRNGTSNVAALFQLTDGQTISIIFHNPDTTPNRVLPTDELISWKWMVNKKDVTIVVAPEKGQDLNVNEVARRIMRLAEKNSARFQAANAKRAERIANIENQKAEIGNLEQSLTGIKSDCEAAELQYNDALESLDNLKKERDKAIQAAQVRAEERIMREANQHDTKEQNVEDLPPPVREVTETEEAKPAVENPEEEVNEEGSEEDNTVNGEPTVPMPNYTVRQVKLSELLKSGRLWDRGETLSRTYPKRDKLMKLSGFKLELSASRKNLHGMKGPDGKEINSRTAQDIWSRLNGAYWDNVKKEFSDPVLLQLLCLDLVDDVTGTDKDVQAGSVGPWADILFPDIHVPIPEGFVPVLDPLRAHTERKKAKAKRIKPGDSWITVEKETEKAYRIHFSVPEGHFDGNEQSFDVRIWAPKSQCVVDGNIVVAMSEWFAKQHDIPYSIAPVTVLPRDPEQWQKWPLRTAKDIVDFTDKIDFWANPAADGSKGQRLERALYNGWKTFSGKNDDGSWFTVSFVGDVDSGNGKWEFKNTSYDDESPSEFLDPVIACFKKAYANGSLTKGDAPIDASNIEKNTEAKEEPHENAIDVQWESDNAYLQTLINGTADMGDRKNHSTKLREIYGRVKDDAEKMAVLKQAMKAWEAYALGKASVFKG